MTKSIFIAIPSHSWNITVPTFLSLWQAKDEASEHDWKIHVECLAGDADIARARNVLLAQFYKSDCTDLVFIDADISWGYGTLARLMAHSADFVCGVYRMKTDDAEIYPVHWKQPRNMMVDPETKSPLLEANLVPGGFWRLSRRCVETMFEHSPKPWMVDVRFPDMEYPEVFEWMRDRSGKRRLSEDYTFCRKWQDAGGQIWVDPALCIDHTGMKTFEGNLYASLAREAQVYRRQAEPETLLDRAKTALRG